MGLFNSNYDAGFLNVPGFGQSATNPLAPVFYDSLGVVNDLSVYQSIYSSQNISAGNSFRMGNSFWSNDILEIGVPALFREDVTLEKDLRVFGVTYLDDLFVRGKRYVETTIRANNGTFRVLATL